MGRYSAKVLVLVSVLSVVLHNSWLCFCKSSMTNCIEKEREVLLQLQRDFSDPDRTLSSWNGEHCCLWKGVTCDELNGHVVKLQFLPPQCSAIDLNGYSICPIRPSVIGELNSSLLNLRYLDHLDLSGIYLARIPKFFGLIKELKYLNLSQTTFQGEVPYQLGNLTKLEVLDISDGYGGVATNIEWVSRLQSLKYLDMSSVNMSEAHHVMQVLNELPSLSHLSLSSCELSNIDLSSHHLANSTHFNHLQYLDLGDNNIVVDLNTSIIFQNMTSLVYLDLSFNSFQRIEGGLLLLLKNKPHLRSLLLRHNRIEGEIAATFGNLSESINLEILDLSSNSMKGVVPNWLMLFTKLRFLNLANNQLVGTIPSSLGQLQVLEALYLHENYLNGTIPSSFWKLSNLQDLFLSGNSLGGLISGTHLSHMSRLKRLDISGNHFTFKAELNWTPPFQLEEVWMDSCKFGTTFPKWLQSQGKVQVMSLSNASIFGDLPRWLANMSLDYMDLSYNQITGPLTNLHFNISTVDLSHNLIYGPLPVNFGRSLSVRDFYINDNRINGIIPSSLCAMDSSTLDLSNNKLFGHIPDCWMSSTLIYLRLSSNNLFGFIPSSIGNLSNLISLHLDGNNLGGQLPLSLQNCSQLTILDVGENNLMGNIPAWLGRRSFAPLNILILRENKFSGSVPSQLCSLSRLQTLDLASNNLQGPIPNCLGFISLMANPTDFFNGDWHREHVVEVMKGWYYNYTNTILPLVKNLDLSSNHLTGLIPEELTLLKGLQGLNLSHNNLSGDIPFGIGDMKSLESLDLSNNHLSGKIPQSISRLTWLEYLNLSHNNFIGPIPKGNQIQTLDDPSIYAGNPLLCGDPLMKKCPGTEVPPVPEIPYDHLPGGDRANKLEKVLFYVIIMLGFGTGFWGFFGVLVFKEDWRRVYFDLVDRWIDGAYATLASSVGRLKRRLRNN